LFEQTLFWSWTHRSTQLIEICPVRLSPSQSHRMSRTGGCALVTTGFFPNCVSVFSRKVEASLPGPCPGGPTCFLPGERFCHDFLSWPTAPQVGVKIIQETPFRHAFWWAPRTTREEGQPPTNWGRRAGGVPHGGRFSPPCGVRGQSHPPRSGANRHDCRSEHRAGTK